MSEITIERELCKGCELCVYFCPKEIIQMDEGFNIKGFHFSCFSDPEKQCTACAICAKICPDVAIEVWR